ncbi:MAG TPA: SGNH hydrolase domain-containing protein [Streptosporangiaceae bacterium]
MASRAHFARRAPARAVAGATVFALLAAGCAAQHATGLAGDRPGAGIARGLPLGAPSLDARVSGLTVLVVGDSWARNLGVGIAAADRARRNIVVNAGVGGCGLMQPAQIRAKGRLVPAPRQCNTWPSRWRDLVARYHPSAVLLEVGYWDGQDSQRLPGTKDVSSITDPVFRRRFDAQADRAIRILSGGGARVYLPTVIDNDGAARANSDAMNAAVRAAVRRHPEVARLLDLHGQLCTESKICPAEIRGIRVYDDTGHPSGPAHDRLGAWILNSVYADLHRGADGPTRRGE